MIELSLFTGAVWALGYQAGVQLEPGAAQAASVPPPPAVPSDGAPESAPHRWPQFRLASAPIPAATQDDDSFLGMSAARLRQRMRQGNIRSVKMNRGGSSVSLRVEFSDGSRACFKPAQTNPQTVPRKEAAAYRLSQILGLNLVAPVIMRSLHRDEILAKLEPSPPRVRKRIAAETIFDDDGRTLGSFAYWIPRIANPQLDTTAGILRWTDWLGQSGTVPADKTTVMAQLSSMLVFDLLQNNSDRFSGGNVLGAPDGQSLYYMDNAFGFQPDPDGHQRCWFYLGRVQKFSRSLVGRLERLRAEDLRRAMGPSGQPGLAAGDDAALLGDAEISALLARRDRALAYIYGLSDRYGADRVLVFP